MKYNSDLQSVHRSGVITLKAFDEGYALTNKEDCVKCDRSAYFQKSVITEHWMENKDFLLNTMEKYGPTHKNCCIYISSWNFEGLFKLMTSYICSNLHVIPSSQNWSIVVCKIYKNEVIMLKLCQTVALMQNVKVIMTSFFSGL